MWKYAKFLLRDEGGWITAAIIGGSMLLSAYMSSKSAKRAAGTQAAAADAAAQAQLEMYYQTREDLAPWREAGVGALGTLEGMIAAGPGEYEESPYYNFLLERGTRGLERGAAAKGMQLSGAENEALIKYGQDIAGEDYQNWLGNYYQSLTPYQSLAGLGQTATAQTGQLGAQTGAGVSNALLAGGQATAAGQLGQTAPWTNMLNWGGNQLMNYYMLSNMGAFNQQQPKQPNTVRSPHSPYY